MMKQALLWVALCFSAHAYAQSNDASGNGVASSGMDQGEARVTVRSDVRLAIKGIRATLSDRLAAMTGAISGQMPAIRGCYTKLVATRPATVGGLRAVVVLSPDSAAPSIEMSEVDGSDAELTTCVGKVLRRLDLHAVERPAAVEITLTFDNSRAQGQAELEQRQAEFVANVERKPDGSYVGHWRTEGGEITFAIDVAAPDGEGLAQSLVMATRAGFSGFLDCRRRAGRQGMNPVGETVLELRIARDGKITGHVIRGTTEDQKRTPGCVEKATSRLQAQAQRRPAGAVMTVRFAAD